EEVAAGGEVRVEAPGDLLVRIVEDGREAAEEPGHRQVHFGVAGVHGGVDEPGAALTVAQEVAAPEIAVQQGTAPLRFGEDARDVEPLQATADVRRQAFG